jgi:hypothetical protein
LEKVCTTCYTSKLVEEDFPTKNGKKDCICKQCMALKKKAYRKTEAGVAAQIYSHQRHSSVKRGHPMPSYTREELRTWLFNQSHFKTLFSTWVNSEYAIGLKPSVDRLCNVTPYTMSNIQLITFQENMNKPLSGKRS